MLLTVTSPRTPACGAKAFLTRRVVRMCTSAATVSGAVIHVEQPDGTTVIGNGTTELTAVAYNIYLSGRWAPDCRVLRVYWLPGDHS